MNITESNNVNTVLRFFLGSEGPTGQTVTFDQAKAAACNLATRANQCVGAGLRGPDVDALFEKHRGYGNVFVRED